MCRWVLVAMVLAVGCAEAPPPRPPRYAPLRPPRPPVFDPLPADSSWARHDGAPGTNKRLQHDIVYCRWNDPVIRSDLLKTEEGDRAVSEALMARRNCMVEFGWVLRETPHDGTE